ncbi:MAG: hypothetical protein QXR19_16885 [Candidatus Jordarchaeaceae archaeon]
MSSRKLYVGSVEKTLCRSNSKKGIYRYPRVRIRLSSKFAKELDKNELVYVIPKRLVSEENVAKLEALINSNEISNGGNPNKSLNVSTLDRSKEFNKRYEISREVTAVRWRRKAHGKIYESARISLTLPRKFINRKFKVLLQEEI